MRLLLDDVDAYKDAIASLAVHVAISLADAVLIMNLERRSTENHADAVKSLSTLAKTRNLAESGVNHFSWLISRKTDFEYGDRRLHPDKDVKMAATRAEQFAAWVYRSFPELERDEAQS